MISNSEDKFKNSVAVSKNDPREEIKKRVLEVSKKIVRKRRNLLLDDRDFIAENLQCLRDSLDRIIEIIDPQSLSSLKEGGGVDIERGSAEDGRNLKGLKDDLIKIQRKLPKDERIDVDEFIYSIREYQRNISNEYELLSLPRKHVEPDEVKKNVESSLLHQLELKLDSLEELGNQAIMSDESFKAQVNALKSGIENSSNYISALRSDCRDDVATELNRLVSLLSRINQYSGVHGPVPLGKSGYRWGLPSGALLSAIDRIEAAIGDAEQGTRCSLELLRETNIAVDRMMYRYEYGLPLKPFGWWINRFNDIKRFTNKINSRSNDNPNTIRPKILLGLSITSSFWILLLLAVSSTLFLARVGTALFTSQEIQEEVNNEIDQTNDLMGEFTSALSLYRDEWEDNLNARIEVEESIVALYVEDLQNICGFQQEFPTLEQVRSCKEEIEPSGETSAEPSGETSAEPSGETSAEPSGETSAEPSGETSAEPSVNDSSASNSNNDLSSERLNSLENRLNRIQRLEREKAEIEQIYQDNLSDLEVSIDSIISRTSKMQEDQVASDFFLFRAWDSLSREIFSLTNNEVHNTHIRRMMLALMAGAIGSVISILIRMHGIEYKKLSSPFLFGLLQPLIGAFTSLVIVAILSTEAVEIIKVFPEELHLRETTAENQENASNTSPSSDELIRVTRYNPVGSLDTHEVYKILIIGFFVGFSERLAKDTLGKLTPGSL